MKFMSLTRPSIVSLLLLILISAAQANSVAYWRFEGRNFLSDSAGSNTLTNHGSVTQTSSAFSNPVPHTGAANAGAATFNGSNHLSAADNPDFTSDQFTLEAFFTPDSIGSSSRLIAGHFGSGGGLPRSTKLRAGNDRYG